MRDRYGEGITVVPHRPEWEHQFRAVADALAAGLAALPVDAIEHVGSTSVRGLPAKLQLASRPGMDIHRYLAGKSAILQDVLAVSDLTAEEKQVIFDLNTRGTPP